VRPELSRHRIVIHGSPGLRDDVPDVLTPSAAFLAIENDMGNGSFA
jgi:hypothetical protein